MTRPPYNLTDGEAWTVADEAALYHLTPCPTVSRAHSLRALHITEVRGPETLASRRLCTTCAQALGHASWPPEAS